MNETQLVHHGDGILENNTFRSCYNMHCRFPNYRINTHDYLYEIIIIYLLIKNTNILGIEKKEHIYNESDKKMLMQLKNIFIKLRDIIDMNGFYYQWMGCDCIDIDKCREKCDSIRGVLIAPCSSLINHSCMPNIGRFFTQKRKIVFYASRPIRKGEQLCCSYGPTVTSDRISRQNFILQNFHFKCACTHCNENKTITQGFDKGTFGVILVKLVSEFTKKYKDKAMMSPFMTESPEYWTVFNKELLEQALTISELIYSHFESYTAFGFLLEFMIYTERAFDKLYGEKCVIPDQC